MKNLMNNPYPNRPHNPIHYEDDDDDDSDEYEQNPDHNNNKFATQNGYYYNFDDSKRHPKKRKLESFVSNNDLDPPRRDIWSEDESFVLLQVWGERFMELGRRSLRGEDWVDVTEKVSELIGFERTEVECRTQLDLLVNKYKKERGKVESGVGSKWVFFKKMDVLLNVRSRGYVGLGCGVDSGEYVFMNPRVYLDRSNVMDEMRDSPRESEGEEEEEGGDEEGEGSGESARVLAESIQRFGEIYEKMEESKRKQMVELEKMRQDFQRELEVQKKQIVERAQAEIEKIREMDDDDEEEDTDTSVDDLGD